MSDGRTAFAASLSRLGLERIGLYLTHWPVSVGDRYVRAWKALVDLRHDTAQLGSIGEAELRCVHAELDIRTEAWGPLAELQVLRDPVLIDIGHAHGKSAARAVLRWHIQLGSIVIPKSVTPQRVHDNINIFDFALSPAEMSAIGALDRGTRIGPDRATFEFRARSRGRRTGTGCDG